MSTERVASFVIDRRDGRDTLPLPDQLPLVSPPCGFPACALATLIRATHASAPIHNHDFFSILVASVYSYCCVDFWCYFFGLYVIQRGGANLMVMASAISLPLQQLVLCTTFLMTMYVVPHAPVGIARNPTYSLCHRVAHRLIALNLSAAGGVSSRVKALAEGGPKRRREIKSPTLGNEDVSG
jgi:hypothetical protein